MVMSIGSQCKVSPLDHPIRSSVVRRYLSSTRDGGPNGGRVGVVKSTELYVGELGDLESLHAKSTGWSRGHAKIGCG